MISRCFVFRCLYAPYKFIHDSTSSSTRDGNRIEYSRITWWLLEYKSDYHVSLKPLKPETQMLIGKNPEPTSQDTEALSVTDEDIASIPDELVEDGFHMTVKLRMGL